MVIQLPTNHYTSKSQNTESRAIQKSKYESKQRAITKKISKQELRFM